MERRHINVRHHVRGQDPPECLGQRHALGREHAWIQPIPPAPLGRVAIDDVEKLLLLADHTPPAESVEEKVEWSYVRAQPDGGWTRMTLVALDETWTEPGLVVVDFAVESRSP